MTILHIYNFGHDEHQKQNKTNSYKERLNKTQDNCELIEGK